MLPTPNVGEAAQLLRQLVPSDAAFLDAPRPFAAVAAPGAKRARGTAPTLLINGCGRSGTHALVMLLRRHGIAALHEGHGREATVGWPYVGYLEGNWKEYWPMSNQPRGSGDVHDPIFKVHRHPLSAIRSIAPGLTSSGACRNPSERRWDARAWRCASRFISLPVPQAAVQAQETCGLSRDARRRLALHYWVKWNLLADRWAAHSFAVETVTAADLLGRWCAHCTAPRACQCPATAAQLLATLARNESNGSGSGGASADANDRVRARKGHGASARRPRPPLSWADLESLDPNMTMVAQRLALEYGYSLAPQR